MQPHRRPGHPEHAVRQAGFDLAAIEDAFGVRAVLVDARKDESREAVYGMPYEEWKAKYQGPATAEQLAAMKKVHPHGH